MKAMAILWLALLAPACRVGEPELVALRGDLPKSIAVWPFVGPQFDAASELLLEGIEVAVRGRGYQVVPAAVASELLRALGPGIAEVEPAAMGQTLSCDAVLQLVVRDFEAAGSRPLREARWDLEWRLISTRGGGVVWSYPHHGTWAPPPENFGDVHRPLDAEPDIVPMGGDPRITYRNANELVASLHRMALSFLPSRSR